MQQRTNGHLIGLWIDDYQTIFTQCHDFGVSDFVRFAARKLNDKRLEGPPL
jgi:hypothetical protein